VVGDKLLTVNDHDLKDVDHYKAVNILKSCGSRFVAQIEREVPITVAPTPSPLQSTLLNKLIPVANSTQYKVKVSMTSRRPVVPEIKDKP